MRYLMATLLCCMTLQSLAADDSTAVNYAPRLCLVADAGPVMPYVRSGQSYGLQLDVSRLLQLGAEIHFNKHHKKLAWVAGLRVGYMYIKTHYHSYMPKPTTFTTSSNIQYTLLGGMCYAHPVQPWLHFVTGMQAGPAYIMSTDGEGGALSIYGEMHMGFLFNNRISAGFKFFASPGQYRHTYQNTNMNTLGYGASGIVSELRVILGKRR